MKKNYLLSAAAAFLLAVTGCSDDIENGGNSGGEGDSGKVYMTVNVSTVSKGALTKAGGTPSNPNNDGAGWGEDGNGFLEEFDGANEGKVYDVNIFLVKYDGNTFDSNPLDFFNDDVNKSLEIAGQGWYESKTGVDPSGGGEPNHDSAGKVTMKVTMNEELTTEGHTYQVFTVVNAGNRIEGITTLGDLRDRVTLKDLWTGTNQVSKADHFIMSTHKMKGVDGIGNSLVRISVENTDETKPATTTVFVERMAARIDLGYAAVLEIDKILESSPVKNKGSFKLTGYKVVNQWKGNSYVFKQVSPKATKNFGEGSSLADAMAGNYTESGNDFKYLGDEVWSMMTLNEANGSYNYVLDPSISQKKVPMNEGDDPWTQFKDSYINYFNPENKDLNRVENMSKIPEAETEPYYGVNDRIYYPVVYTKENTLDREAQVNGYSTGVIFESEFMPDGDNFKVSFYNKDAGSIESVPLDNNKTFLLAVHKNGEGATVRSVYKDLPSVAACAFNLEEGSNPNLLKGLMNGWDGMTTLPDFADVQKAINSMSDQNGFEIAFKKYLSDMIKGETNWKEELTMRLCYTEFRKKQNENGGGHLPDTYTDPNDFTPDQIGNLYQFYNVSLYKGGKSYYKFWIRHNDNGNDGMMGVMEFCIVRNNVYQLYVTGVRGLGDPLPYTPGKDTPDKPDETDDVTIDVTIYVKDWVKRTNKDIII